MTLENDRPYPPEIVRDRINALAARGQDAPAITRGHTGVITAKLIKLCGSDFERYRLLYYLFPYRWPMLTGVTSKSLKTWEWWALSKWTDVHKDEDMNEWVCHPSLAEEIKAILAIDIEKEALTYDPDKISNNQEKLMETMGVKLEAGPMKVEKETFGLKTLEDMAEKPKKTEDQINLELGYEPTPTEIYDPTKGMPAMECGHEADQFSPTGRPFCGRHPDRLKAAYFIRSKT